MAKIAFTAGRVSGFKCPPEKKQAFLWDSVAPGLGLRVTPSGRPAYVFQGVYQGRDIRITIGATSAWSIPNAQTKARELQRLIDEGKDPRELKRETLAVQAKKRADDIAQAVTVGELWGVYIEARRPHWGERHLQDHLDMMRQGGKPKIRGKGLTVPGPLAHFAAMRLIDVTAEAIQAWAETESSERPTRAWKGLNLLQTFLNWCGESREYAGLVSHTRNRRARETLGKPRPKQDALLKEQLPAFFRAVQQLRNPAIGAYLLCLLLTGARANELLTLRWEDINTKWRGLTIRDKEDSKGGFDGKREIPLTPYVWHLLDALPRRNEWVFSSPTLSQPISKPNERLADACAVAGIDGLTIHGLRRSFGTLSEWLELPAGVVAQIQGHRPSATAEKHYRVRPLDMLRMHHERFEAWILEQAGIQFKPGKWLYVVGE